MVECTGLENRRRATYRGFESHPLRHLLFGLFYAPVPNNSPCLKIDGE